MRVMLFGPIPPPMAGVQVHLMSLRDHLRAAGVAVSAVNITRFRQPDHDGLYFPETATGVLGRMALERPHILHVHLGGDLSRRDLLLCLACAEWPGARSVVTCHSGGLPLSDLGRQASPDSFAGRILRRVDHLVAVNADIAGTLHRFGCDPARVSIIEPYAGIAPATANAPWPARFGAFVAKHAPVLLGIGGLEREYGIELQVAALELIRRTHPRAGLIFIGSGTLEHPVRRHARNSPVGPHVLIAGDVPHDETLAALARSDLFLRTTEFDGDSVSVREALALGTPVVATRTSLRPAGVHLMPERTPEALAEVALACISRREPPVPSTDARANLDAVLALYRRLRPD